MREEDESKTLLGFSPENDNRQEGEIGGEE